MNHLVYDSIEKAIANNMSFKELRMSMPSLRKSALKSYVLDYMQLNNLASVPFPDVCCKKEGNQRIVLKCCDGLVDLNNLLKIAGYNPQEVSITASIGKRINIVVRGTNEENQQTTSV